MNKSEFIVRLKGLPWSAQEKDIQDFFEDCKILSIQTPPRADNADPSTAHSGGDEVDELSLAIHLVHLQDGRSSGEAFVEFESAKDLEKAMTFNKKHLGTRYINIYKVKRQEMDYVLGHHSNPTSNGYYGNMGPNAKVPIVKLKGVPYDCSKEEIFNFLPDLELVPNGISIIQDQYGRCNGEVFVHFAHPDSVAEALKKNKNLIGNRYIEVVESNSDFLIFALNKSQQLKQAFLPSNNNHYYGYNYKNNSGYSDNRYRGYHNVPMNYNTEQYGYRGNNRPTFCSPNNYNQGFSNGQYGGYDNNKRPFIGGYFHRATMHHSSTGHTIQMKGLPFSVCEEDIRKFFSPLEPVLIHIQQSMSGRATGIAHVDFNSLHEAQEALKKDKEHIDDRYIDLYLKSYPGKQGIKNASDGGSQNST